ncbi:hypothetical protein RDWZM_000289 [Blomia tropicalis]|uniref:RRM domain-containing protein n=1 Tax=Blomia tropicalis TaxID=40697 RepID=A0A9Q0MA31_BLOTA|nr:hypothetical protein RDWZM_000289 [Blomia tropicalis]
MTSENQKLDMSLDEIIRMDGIKGGRSFGRGQRGFRRNGLRTNRRPPQSGQQYRHYEPKRLGNRHDKGRFQNFSRQNGFGNNRKNATLRISNLASTVTNEDIEELFSSFGQVIRSTIHFDQYGTSLGSGDIIFDFRSDAIQAQEKLNNVPLDGKPLRIVLIDDDGSANDAFSSYIRNSQENNVSRNRRQFSRNNSRTNDRSRRGPPPNAEDLDREMDEWRMEIEDKPSPKVDID